MGRTETSEYVQTRNRRTQTSHVRRPATTTAARVEDTGSWADVAHFCRFLRRRIAADCHPPQFSEISDQRDGMRCKGSRVRTGSGTHQCRDPAVRHRATDAVGDLRLKLRLADNLQPHRNSPPQVCVKSCTEWKQVCS